MNKSDQRVASRFEVYINGIELANGFHELSDAKEQRQRFLHDLEKRKYFNMPQPPLDEYFLAAIDHLPNCSGVAMGIDRLLMIISSAININEILAFPITNA